MGKTKHDTIAQKLARQKRSEYNKGKGPDIQTSKAVIEVEVDFSGFEDGLRQLRGFQKSRYLAVPKELVPVALERLKGLKTGLMDENGNIKKSCKR